MANKKAEQVTFFMEENRAQAIVTEASDGLVMISIYADFTGFIGRVALSKETADAFAEQILKVVSELED